MAVKRSVMKTKRILILALVSTLQLHAKTDPTPPSAPQDKVQIALLLDTSNSMDGLIDQARTQLWKVVNTFVDAVREGRIDPAIIPASELAAEMREMTPAARAAFIEKAARERAFIQTRITELNRQREAHVAEEFKKQAVPGAKTLDVALVETTREQASARGNFSFR